MKLRINESGYSHKKYNLISEDEYNYWYNVGMNAFDNGERCVPAHNKEIVDYMTKNPAKIGSDESKKSNQIAKAWADGWTFRNLYVDNQGKNEGLKENTRNRYWVTDDDYIPISSQPNNGYTKLGAIQRAQREAEQAAKLFGLEISDAAKWYHIMDSNNNICYELDNTI